MKTGVYWNPPTPFLHDRPNYPAGDFAPFLQKLRNAAPGVDVVVIFLTAARPGHLSWPTPQPEEVAGLARQIHDCWCAGYQVELNIGLLWTLSEEEFGGPGVCGANKGDVINGRTIPWDVPPIPPNNRQACISWWQSFLGQLVPLVPQEAIYGIAHRGTPELAFAGEWKPYAGFPPRQALFDYAAEALPQMRAACPWPVGGNISPGLHNAETAVAGLEWLDAHGALDECDFLDVTVGRAIRIELVASSLSSKRSGLVVPSDFKLYHQETNTAGIGNHTHGDDTTAWYLAHELGAAQLAGAPLAWLWPAFGESPTRWDDAGIFRSDGSLNQPIADVISAYGQFEV